MKTIKRDLNKKLWLLIAVVTIIAIALIWIFEKGETLGISVAR